MSAQVIVEQCPTCPSRGVDQHHVEACAVRAEAIVATLSGVATLDNPPPELATRDLIAHLRSLSVDGRWVGLTTEQACAIALTVAGVGWRPVVGS